MSRKGEGVGIFCERDDIWTGYQIICGGRYTTNNNSTHTFIVFTCLPIILSAFMDINSFNPLNNPTRKVLL